MKAGDGVSVRALLIRLSFLKEWLGRDAPPARKRALQTLKLLLLVGLFVGLFWFIPLKDVLEVITTARPGELVVGLLLGLPVIYLNAFTLGILTRKQGVTLSVNKLFAIQLVVKFYQLFLPGAIISSGIRWMKISPEGKSIETLAAMAFYRLLEWFLVISVGVFWLITGIGQVEINASIIGLALIGVAVLWLGLTKGSLRIAKWLEQRPHRQSEHSVDQYMQKYLSRIVQSLAAYARLTGAELWLLVGAGILSDLVSLISYVFIAWSVGIELSIANIGWMRSVFLLASLTPLTVAGGIGIREVSFVVMMSTFDISPEIALAYSLLLFCRTLYLSLLGGFVELFDTIYARLKKSN